MKNLTHILAHICFVPGEEGILAQCIGIIDKFLNDKTLLKVLKDSDLKAFISFEGFMCQCVVGYKCPPVP